MLVKQPLRAKVPADMAWYWASLPRMIQIPHFGKSYVDRNVPKKTINMDLHRKSLAFCILNTWSRFSHIHHLLLYYYIIIICLAGFSIWNLIQQGGVTYVDQVCDHVAIHTMSFSVIETKADLWVWDRQLLVRTSSFLHISLQIDVWISKNSDQDWQLFQLSPEHWSFWPIHTVSS